MNVALKIRRQDDCIGPFMALASQPRADSQSPNPTRRRCGVQPPVPFTDLVCPLLDQIPLSFLPLSIHLWVVPLLFFLFFFFLPPFLSLLVQPELNLF